MTEPAVDIRPTERSGVTLDEEELMEYLKTNYPEELRNLVTDFAIASAHAVQKIQPKFAWQNAVAVLESLYEKGLLPERKDG